MDNNKLYYGAAYYDEYMPESRVEEDMRLLKKAGMNLIRIAESTWSTWEPRDGEFDFTSLHRVLDSAQRHGIKVIVGTPTYAIPPWMAKKYPDILADTHDGPSRYGHRQNMDLTSRDYLFHCERIIRRLMEECRGYDCIIGYQLDNETKHYDTCGPRVQELFRSSLRSKYKTIENLNQAFGFAYWSNSVADWDELPDPRGTINGSYGAEFEAFQRSLVTDFLAGQAEIVREYLREGQFITHNFDYAWRDYSFGLQPDCDQYDAARAVDVVGCDIYHPAGLRNTGAEISFGGDLARSLKKDNFLVLETQCQGMPGRQPFPGQLRLQAFHHLANGANGVEYWHWHSIHNAVESYWKGVLSHDLTPGRAYEECAGIGADFRRLEKKLVGLQKYNKAAIIVSQRSLHGFKWYPVSGWSHVPCREYNDYLRWVYDALYKLNIEVDLVPDTQGDFSEYEFIVAPCLYSADERLIEALRDYVLKGGKLLATMRSFFADENLKIRHYAQPYGLTDVFGMTYDEFTIPDGITLSGLPGPVEDWMEMLQPTTATVLAAYEGPGWQGIPAMTVNSFGEGSAAYIGCYAPDALEQMLRKLFKEWDFRLPQYSWPLVVKRGVNMQDKDLIYLMNYSAERKTLCAPAASVELLSGSRIEYGAPLRLEPWDVKILEVIE